MTTLTRMAAALSSLLFAATAGAQHDAPTFGFPAGFSVRKMDRSADPRRDFTRYAAGTWYDAMEIPADDMRISGLDLMNKRTDIVLRELLEEAARNAASAPRGSPTQQVGDLYAAGLDESRLAALGNTPLQPVFQRIRAIADKKQLAEEVGRLTLATNDVVFLGGAISPGIRDRTKYVVVATDGSLVLGNFDDYLRPEAARFRDAFVKYVAGMMTLAGFSERESREFAAKALAVETRIAKVRQPLLERNDPDKRYVPLSYDQLKALTPAFDWDAYLAAVGLPPPAEVTAVEVRAMAERSAVLGEMSLAEQKKFLCWEYLRRVAGALSPEFTEVTLALSRTYYGDGLKLPPRSKRVFDTIAINAGHPLARLFVEKNFSPEAKRDVESMVQRVRAEFRSRLVKNTWLTAATRKQALAKLDKVQISVGYPDKWIDYSKVDVRPGDYFGSLERLREFLSRRDMARFGGPIVEDEFANPAATLPTVINAAYNPMRNSIEIPAAFLQAPIYDPKGDAATNFCALGAVIGHELTHGFDSGGRHFDEIGRARNWWAKADERKFLAETRKLERQSSAYQVLPGLHANGPLTVTENLADVGGIAFAYGALEKYLKAHPAENKVIDGLTQPQRCFIAWGQMWSDKARDGYLRQVTATNAHAAGQYRAYAAAQHEPGFYKAFGIRKGDPMWLDPKQRVKIW